MMNLRILALALLAAPLAAPAADDFGTFTSVGELGMTITNFGVIGHGYNIEGQPSCLYKQYSDLDFEQVEHFSYGGLWVGGVVGGEPRVSTAVMDGSFGGAGWEWNNVPAAQDRSGAILVRSTFPDSPNFHPEAVSHQDFLMSFTDTSRVVPGTGEVITGHTPLGLRVDLDSHAWNYSYANAFVILDLTITNISHALDPAGTGWTIDSLFVGYWIDEAVGNFNLHNYYAPGRGGWLWYDNLAGVVLTDQASPAAGDSIWMAVGYDADGDNGYAESILGCRFLGGSAPHVADPRRIKPRANTWIWNRDYNQSFPALVMPNNEAARYAAMQARPSLSDASFPYGTANSSSWMMLASAGSFGRLAPGESLNAVFAIGCGRQDFVPEGELLTGLERLQRKAAPLVANTTWARIAWDGEDKNRDGILQPEEDLDGDGVLDRYLLPNPPPAPRLAVEVGERELTLYWRNDPESFVDPILGEQDFEGYRIYSSLRTPGAGGTRTLVAQFDIINEIWPNTGLDDITVRRALGVDADSMELGGVWYHYAFRMENLLSGRPQGNWLAVSAYDHGLPANNLPSLESAVTENWVFVFPGSLPDGLADGRDRKPGVYPNPYRGRASWDGSGPYDRMIWFTHLPARCTVSIFTLAGDFVDSVEHDAATYQGLDVALIRKTQEQVAGSSIGETPFVFSGGEHAWDLVSRHNQAIATGLYLFTVEDKATGKVEIGKFAVIK
ncbi:MAG: hypothetical protein Q8O14_15045 [bacterium]|nr:hypothetical protein [bacterium]